MTEPKSKSEPRKASNLSLPYTPSPYNIQAKPDKKTATKKGRGNGVRVARPAVQSPAVDPDLSPLQAFTSNAEDATPAQTQSLNITNVASTAHPTVGNPVAALFRLSQSSRVQSNPKLWMDQLRSVSFAELTEKAGAKHPNAVVRGVEGLLSGDAGGGFSIQQDDEVGAYLDCAAHLGRVVFSVTLI